MRRLKGFGTLGSRIYTTFTIMMFAAIFVMQLVAFQFTVNTVRNSTIDTNRKMLNQLTVQIDSYVRGMERLAEAVLEDENLQYYFMMKDRTAVPPGETAQSPPHDFTVSGEVKQKIQTSLEAYIRARDDISTIALFPDNGKAVISDQTAEINPWAEYQKQEWYSRAVQNHEQTVVTGSYVQNLIKGKYDWVVSLSRGITSPYSGDFLGVLLVDLKFNRIQELCQSMAIGEKGYSFVLDDEGNYVFHPTQQLVYSDIRSEPIEQLLKTAGTHEQAVYDTGDKYFMVKRSPLTGWYIVSVLLQDDIITDWRNVQISYAAIGLVLFLVVGIATNGVTIGITKPIRKLQNIMKSVETGEFRLIGPIRATEEVRELAREYDLMVTRIRELMRENDREQELKRKSDLKALQAQINPHFLYNTLDSIMWMGEMRQYREVVQMTSALSRLFRISISKGRELIPIKDEIAHVQSYLTIEEMRYRDKFDYVIDVSPEIYEEQVLKITLQPLVENAIYHGIKEADWRGLIRIEGYREGEHIILKVKDNGRGMDEQKLKQFREEIAAPFSEEPKYSSMGMGTRNVHARFRLYFGDAYGITCSSSPDEGTIIQVKFPAGKTEAGV